MRPASQPGVDPDRIALIGFSIGASWCSVAIANEPRLAAGVLVMGGADVHEILAACNQEIQDARGAHPGALRLVARPVQARARA